MDLVPLNCPACHTRVITASFDGQLQCPRCHTEMQAGLVRPAVVPVNIQLPGGRGLQTQVTQQCADNLMTVLTGGFLVALGAAIAALFLWNRDEA